MTPLMIQIPCLCGKTTRQFFEIPDNKPVRGNRILLSPAGHADDSPITASCGWEPKAIMEAMRFMPIPQVLPYCEMPKEIVFTLSSALRR